jgi:hypothetical protein
MTQLIWNDSGKRLFEVGVDHGVFYKTNGDGVVWNGLTSVTESLSGGEARPYYLDGVKYLNKAAPEEFGGTINAYTFPEEFAEYDGTVELYDGFSVNQQNRKPFGLCYRTMLGNDIKGVNYGYKIHIIYNVLAAPSTKAFNSLGSNIDPLVFSWAFSTTPITIPGLMPSAHIILDSTKVSIALMRAVEGYLYGSPSRSSKLIPLDKLIYWFESGGEPFEIVPHYSTGANQLVQDGLRDIISTDVEGVYRRLPTGSRLTPTSTSGVYTLET